MMEQTPTIDPTRQASRLTRAYEPLVQRLNAEWPNPLSDNERAACVAAELCVGLMRGGFEGYLESHAGDRATLAPDALRAIGCPQAARVCESAFCRLRGGEPDEEWGARLDHIEDLRHGFGDAPFEPNDREFEPLRQGVFDALVAFAETATRS
jgi:hypothetical protein